MIFSRAHTPRPPLAGMDAKVIPKLFSACPAPCHLPDQAGGNEMQTRARTGEGHLPSRRTVCQPLVYPSKTSLISNVAAVLLVCTVDTDSKHPNHQWDIADYWLYFLRCLPLSITFLPYRFFSQHRPRQDMSPCEMVGFPRHGSTPLSKVRMLLQSSALASPKNFCASSLNALERKVTSMTRLSFGLWSARL